MILLAALAGMGLAGGVWLIIAGARPAEPAAASGLRTTIVLDEWVRRFDVRRLGLAAGAALAAAVIVRWPVAVGAAAAAGWMVPLPGERARRRQAEARTEAIAQWCEMLRDAAGTARGIEGILVATASSAPGPIRPEIRQLAHRLEHQPLEQALDALAGDLAHPIGDLVATALRVAASAGSRRVAAVLGNLAVAAHHEASMRRRVEVARARPRSTMRLVALIVGLFVAALLLFAREYLSPYGTAAGQLVLLLIGLYWALGFLWMNRLGRLPQVNRLLSTPKAGGARQAMS